MTEVYYTQEGYDALLEKIEEKRIDLTRVSKERATALANTSESDMNDPELVDLQQQETTLSIQLAEQESLLSRASIKHVTDSNRCTTSVQVGSIIEIQRTNITTQFEHPAEIWEISGFDETNIKERMLSYNSPLASCLMGQHAGDCLEDVKIGDSVFEIYIEKLYQSWTNV